MIKLYTKTICPKCMVAKGILASEGLEYEAINTDENEEAKQKLIDEGFMAVPITEYEGKFYIGQQGIQQLVDDLR